MTSVLRPSSAPFAPHLSTGRSRAAFVGGLWSLIHAGLPSLSAAFVFFVSAAFLGPADFGQLAIAAGIVSVALALSPMAFGEALVQRMTLRPSQADAVFWLNAALAFAYVLALVLLAPALSEWFAVPELTWLIPLLAFKVPFELMASVPSAMIVRSMAFRLLALRTAIGATMGLVVSVGMLTAGYGLMSLVVSQVAVSVTTFAVAFWTSGWRPGRAGRFSDLRALARYGLFASGQRILGLVRIDHLVLGVLAGPALLGLLVFAQRVFNLLSNVAGGALGSVTHVTLSSMQDEPEKAGRAVILVTFAAAAIGFPAFAGAAIVIDDIVAVVFAETWAEAATAAQLFCLVGFLSTPGIVQSAFVRSRGHADWMFWYQLAQDATTVVVIALTYRFGVEAMVAAIVLKTMLIWPVSLWMCLRLSGIPLARYARTLLGPTLATSGMIAVLLLMPTWPGVAGIGLQIFVGGALYPVLLMSFSRKTLVEASQLVRRKPEHSV